MSSYVDTARLLTELSHAVREGKLSPEAADELRDRILLTQDSNALLELRSLLTAESPQETQRESEEKQKETLTEGPQKEPVREQKTEAPQQKEHSEQSLPDNIVSFGGFDVRRREAGVQKFVQSQEAPAEVVQFPAPEPARAEALAVQHTEARAEAFNREALQKEAEQIHQDLHQANPLSFLAHSEYVSGYLGLYEFLQDKYFDRDNLSEEELRDFSLQMEHVRKMVPVLREKLRLEEVAQKQNDVLEDERVVPVADASSAIPEITEQEREVVRPPEKQQRGGVGLGDIVKREKPQEVLQATHSENNLHSPEISRMLDELLKDWLGGSGLLGFGSSVGIRHPKFKALRKESVSRILNKDLPPDTLRAIGKKMPEDVIRNAREWERRYGVVPKDQDFETYLREVVSASVDQKRVG